MNETTPNPSEHDIGETGDLARRARGGDRASFQELYDHVAPVLYAWTYLRIQGSTAPHLDPQDILQEVWLRALRGFERYDPARSFRGWILGITKNVLLHGYRKSSNDALRARGQSSAEQQPECPDSVTSISTRFAKDDAIQRFLAYVGDLSIKDRMLVLYCGIEEYTCAEAATRLGLSPDAASKRWQSLRARMRESGSLRALALEESA